MEEEKQQLISSKETIFDFEFQELEGTYVK